MTMFESFAHFRRSVGVIELGDLDGPSSGIAPVEHSPGYTVSIPAIEDIPNIVDGKQRYDIFVKAYNETREHGGINGLTPSEVFLQKLITSKIRTRTKQQSVTQLGNQKCNLSMQI